MKKPWGILYFIFFIFCLFLFKPRQDIVFAAIDKSQSIKLFEKGNDFELSMEDNNTFRGTYTLMSDTVFLSYQDESAASSKNISDRSDVLPEKLCVSKCGACITATDGKPFFAEIYIDTRQESISSEQTVEETQMLQVVSQSNIPFEFGIRGNVAR